jgi:hypothetical protein
VHRVIVMSGTKRCRRLAPVRIGQLRCLNIDVLTKRPELS